MADEKKVRIGVDASSYDADFQRIKASAESLARDMITASRQYTTSAREALQDIEEQIKAIEKRNRIDSEGRKMSLETQFRSGAITEDQFKTRTQQIGGESRTDTLQVQLLRELIDTIKQQAKDEIRENRAEVERRIQGSRTVNVLDPKGDPREILKETIQQYELGRVGQEEIGQRGMFDAAGRGLPYLQGVAGSSNIYEATARVGQTGFGRLGQMGGALGLLGGIGFIGAAAAGRAIQASLPYQQNMGRLSGLTGMGIGSFVEFGREYENYGYTMDQALASRFNITQARGTRSGAGQATLDALLLQRGMSLDEGLITNLERLQRGEGSGLSTRGNVEATINALRGTGAIKGNDFSSLSEYLNILVGIGQEQIKTLGRVDTGVNAKMVAAISDLDDALKNPEYLTGVVNSLRQGAINAPNSQTEAFQYAILSRKYPNKSLFELQEMRETGEYLPDYLKALQDVSGGGDMFRFSLMSQFGLSAAQARDVGNFKSERFNDVMSQTFSSSNAMNLEGRAGMATDALSANMAKWTNTFEQTGKDLIDAFESFKGGLEDFKEAIKEGQKQVKRVENVNQQAADAMREAGKVIEAAVFEASLRLTR